MLTRDTNMNHMCTISLLYQQGETWEESGWVVGEEMLTIYTNMNHVPTFNFLHWVNHRANGESLVLDENWCSHPS